MCIPKDAVRHSVLRDQAPFKIIDAVIGPEKFMTPVGSQKCKALRILGNRAGKVGGLVSLHWTPLSPKALESSLWGTKLSTAFINPGDSEILNPIDLTCANNISIVLKSF